MYVFLAIVGKQWLDLKNELGGRRLDDAADWVRIEIEAALEQKKLLIPILVEGAEMPTSEALPKASDRSHGSKPCV